MIGVGLIVRPQGNRGEVVVASSTDFGAERFAVNAIVFGLRGGQSAPMRVVTSREHDGRWIVGFDGVSTIDQAEALRGVELRIPADDLRPLEAGAHYVHDLVGCRVETAAGALVGTIEDVRLESGIPLLVAAAPGGEVLIPFTEAICRHVDVTARLIVIDAPEGLIELNQPGRK